MLKSKDVAILDIGSRKVTVLIGSKTAQNVFNIKASGEGFYDGYQQGEWLSEESLFVAIKKALGTAENAVGARVKKLYIGVPAEFSAVQCKNVSVNFGRTFRVSDDEINRLFEKGDTYKSDPDFTVINCSAVYYMCDETGRRIIEPRGLTAYKLSGLISYVLCERRFVKLMEAFANDLKLKEVEYVSSDWAKIMSLFEPEQRDKYVLLADVGYMSSSVAVARGDGLLSLMSFSIGGAHIAGDINQVLEIPFRDAEEIKDKIDLNLAFSKDDFYESYDKVKAPADIVNEIAKARIENLGEIIESAIEKSDFKCPAYVPLYLTGEGISFMRGAKEFLSSKTQKTVEIVAPNVPGFSRADCSSAISVLDVASRLNEGSGRNFFKTLFGLK